MTEPKETDKDHSEHSLASIASIVGRFKAMPDYAYSNFISKADAMEAHMKSTEFRAENPTVSNIERLAQKKGKNTADERFRVTPDYAYPNTKMNREELRLEMNKKSFYFHTLRLPTEPQGVGQVALEIMQCFGLPKPDSKLGSEASAFCVAVCGSHAFRTDTMPPVANPIWLSRMRRACIFPIFHAYARMYIGVFGQNPDGRRDAFAGRIVVDIAQLRPNCTYDITLPLRRSAHVYEREQRGAIRIRVHLHWYSEKKAILSYLPKKLPKNEPAEDIAVHCCDVKSFQNVARVVHGDHMPGRFNAKHVRASAKEIQLTQIYLLRYIRKNEFRNLTQWRVPMISAFLFGAWMHCVYTESVTYIPGHFITFVLLYLWKNYAYYRLTDSIQNGFIAPSWEELFLALVFGRPNSIAPLEMEVKESCGKSVMDDIVDANKESGEVDLKVIAKNFLLEMKLRTERRNMRIFHNVFKGKHAVDYLVKHNFAETREVAVALGQQLMTGLSLFAPASDSRDFKDDDTLYQFLNYDPNRFVIKTYKPLGKRLFGLLGLLPDHEPQFSEAVSDMPYTTGIDHPHLTVKEALVIRSKESMKMMEEEKGESSKTKSRAEIMAAGLDELMGEQDDDKRDSSSLSKSRSGDFDSMYANDPNVEVIIMPKPPNQDMLQKPTSKGKPIPEIMAETRNKLHSYLFHVFNDRVYAKPRDVSSSSEKQGGRKRRNRLRTFIKRKLHSLDESVHEKSTNPKDIEDENDRILETGKYSHPNPWISRIGTIIQPLNEMVIEGLCFFRALYNIFTWKDPILTFWITVIGPVLVVILHCFPWRLILGIAGIVLFGPQNWFFRWRRERKYGPDEFDPDKIVKKRKTEDTEDALEAPLFSMYAPDNQPISNEEIDDTNVRKVVVPYSALMYQRFYDFPPETEYARVIRDQPPTKEQMDASRILFEARRPVDPERAPAESKGPFLRIRRNMRLRRRNQGSGHSISSDDTSSGEFSFKSSSTKTK
mmetsp:Transcript_1048/g.2220  ORF Transcript_1048/g.2220 Transcript_1048/m.2220 type:complete len:995 (+) Transcript_1048:328-3312(+)|eukprot:scaffold426_cov219-Amphora_coffeaeformis.AAC.37